MGKRVIVYEYRDSEEVFEIPSIEEEQHELAHAEQAMRDPWQLDHGLLGYHFEWRDE